ncbi:MAG: hypothetical protein JKY34_00360, partial [Kordiimonadaceae bacterium]|nr:hypothetical protein [Kordiimonadaceae bacterium]
MTISRKTQALSAKPLSIAEGHKAVLALLRAGALEQAEKEFYRLHLDEIDDNEDVMGLSGRLLKSKALEQVGDDRRFLALAAADKYAFAYSQTGGTYSGINTASLSLVGGARRAAEALAREILTLLEHRQPEPGEDAYYHMATRAEAQLILGDTKTAQRSLRDAQHLDPHNYEAHASTLKQFDMVLKDLGESTRWLNPLRPPKALHFAGHIFGLVSGPHFLNPAHEDTLRKMLTAIIADAKVGFAYGALAAGSDILIAELLIEAGVELHVVQPCFDAPFVKNSLVPFGEQWIPRFEACIEAAASVRYVLQNNENVDDLTIAFSSEIAMGLAVLKAQALATVAKQIVVWDRHISATGVGTARDAILWNKCKRPQVVVPYPVPRNVIPFKPKMVLERENERGLKAMVFADVRGFGALTDDQVPAFITEVLAPLAACVEEEGPHVKHVNTWGDGLFLVLDNVERAANVALKLQACFQGLDMAGVGLPETLALRIGAHYGPVHEMEDPFMGRP